MARKSWNLYRRSCWVGLEMAALRISLRVEIPLAFVKTVRKQKFVKTHPGANFRFGGPWKPPIWSHLTRRHYLILIFRNIKRQPLSPGILTTVGQFLATICMVIPKILLVSSTFIYAPFLFPIAYVFEYLLIIGYNKLITGSANGKWFFFPYFLRSIFANQNLLSNMVFFAAI